MNNNGKLYSVATPIGNLSDITFRAIATLKAVDLIAAEDTRHSKLLLDHYSIHTPMVSYHHYNESQRAEQFIEKIHSGVNIALISDAGTPLISDPGASLISLCQKHGIQVVPIPGPSAVIAALSAAGMPGKSFLFLGFLSAKANQRESELENHKLGSATLVCYEAPHRILSMLESCHKIFGADREICIAKELTKSYESILKTTASELLAWLMQDPSRQKGEFVVLISPERQCGSGEEGISVEAKKLLKQLVPIMPIKQASQITSETFGESKNALYQFALELKQ